MTNAIKSNRFTPTLEGLESREVPTTLTWNCGSGNDTVYIHDDGDGNIAFFVNGVGKNPSGGWHNVTQFNLNTGGGNDTVIYFQYANGMNFNVGDGHVVDGERSVNLDLNVNLGSGSDYFRAEILGDIGANKILDIDVNGGSQSDLMWVFAGYEWNGGPDRDVDVKQGGKLKIDLDGDSGNDTMGSFYDGELDGLLDLYFRGDDGSDTLWRFVDFQPGSNGQWFWHPSSVETKHLS
jgi:hypothetical protein